MIPDQVIDSILTISDESGGDNALDGFEFQMSSAIYLFFSEIEKETDSALVYEKVEDFIIFNEQINLYQAKSISRNLTPNVLYTPSRKTKFEDSGLSIIEKMNLNYLKVKEKSLENPVFMNLIICENQKFSKRLSNNIEGGIEELKKINFNDLSETAKSEIIDKTTFDEYEWSNINAHRIIPKSRHEEVTRIHIEDVITQLFGENKVNSAALYTSLTLEIKKIRRNKTKLTSNILKEKIVQFSSIEEHLKFNDYSQLLSENDRRNFKISSSFIQLQNNLMIHNHPSKNDYRDIKKIIMDNDFEHIEDIENKIKTDQGLVSLKFRLSRHDLIALILIVLAKEVLACN